MQAGNAGGKGIEGIGKARNAAAATASDPAAVDLPL
jgi:hypothetical protein